MLLSTNMNDQPLEHRDGNVDNVSLRPMDSPFRLPQELMEFVIDYVSDHHHDRIGAFRNLAPLRACSLVAKGWLKHAQRRIFKWIELPDTIALYRLADVLRASPHLASYVQFLSLSRRAENAYMGYSPGCVEVIFPTVLGGLLSKLRGVTFDFRSAGTWTHIQVKRDSKGDIEAVFKDTSLPFFPFLPIHPRFPLRLSAFSSLEELSLGFVRFQNFYDFARTLYDCKRLRGLHCGDVDWVNPCTILPPFMVPAPPRGSKGAFLSLLERFSVSVRAS